MASWRVSSADADGNWIELGMPGPSAILLQQLALSRLEEARSLSEAGHHAGAWYLGGYVLELALKAVVCKTLRVGEYPESALGGKALKTHVTEDLVLLAGLKEELESRLRKVAFRRYWEDAASWSTQDRYRSDRTREDVIAMLNAYENAEDGVLTWLINLW